MEKINIMINGLPGNMATRILHFAIGSSKENVSIVPYSLTGLETIVDGKLIGYGDYNEDFLGRAKQLKFIKPDVRDNIIDDALKICPFLIAVDYTQPTAVNGNAEFYCKNKIPFVMGTTGGDRNKLEETVRNSEICAVIATNMATPIIALQDFLEQFADKNPGIFKGYKVEIEESHQAGKTDLSGTAITFTKSFAKMGIEGMPYDAETAELIKAAHPSKFVDEFGNSFRMIRDPEEQKAMGVPKEHLKGHGWHTYTFKAPYD